VNLRFLRYLAPNLITMSSLAFGMMSIACSMRGSFALAAWFVIFSALTDKLDGFVARLLKGTSELGVQLDSFADQLNFGIAPSVLFYAYLSQPGSPVAYPIVIVASLLWVLAVTFRLARYNIVGDDPKCRKLFFGVPTTLMGGLLCGLFLTFLKYGADFTGTVAATEELKLFGSLKVGQGVWVFWPVLCFLGAYLMASTVKIPKLGPAKNKLVTGFIFANVIAGYVAGATRHFPEFLTLDAVLWIVIALVWGTMKKEIRSLRPPPLFPRKDVPVSQMPQRPEEVVLLQDDEDEVEAVSDKPTTGEAKPIRSARG
jgi:CDP-diacylglycerol--serine O-phosphatidyltransferase